MRSLTFVREQTSSWLGAQDLGNMQATRICLLIIFPISLSVSPYSWLILQVLIMLLSSFTKSLPRHLEVIESKLKEISTQWAKSLAA